MKIAIIGTGGVGGYVGAQLIRSGENEVVFVARGKHLEAIQAEGLKVEDENMRYTVHPDSAVQSLEGQGIFDLVIIAVKSYGMQGALDMIEGHVTAETMILPLLNGVEHDSEVLARYPDSRVLNGCIYIFSNITEAGAIKKYGGVFYLFYGSRTYSAEQLVPLKEAFAATGLKHKLTDKIDLEVWRKYLLIAAFASMTSYYQVPLGVIAETHIKELDAVLREIAAVAKAKGITLTEENIQNVIDRVKKVPYDSKTSMQLDFEAGRQTELEALTGYVVQEGRKLGVNAPMMSKYYKELAVS